MLNRRLAIALMLVWLAGIACAATSKTPERKIDPQDLKNIMLVKDVKPGMKGYGKTVFRGTKIETFEVEVLSVMEKMNFGKSLILVKMKGGPITERGANLIQGMSGSPVYVNGKLLGAFAYGEAFIKEPIGMVTPIEHMLEAWDPSLPSTPSTFYQLDATNLDKPIPLAGRLFSKVAIDDGSQSYDSGTLVFRPLAMPLAVRGMSPRMMSVLAEQLKPLNMVPVAGAGVPADKANLNVELVPGAAVGLSLVTGDLDITGVGTITYRRGNRILAFGHPMISSPFMNGMGPLDAPMTTAYVHEVFPSVMISSKIASPIRTVGRVFQDRPWSIAGEIGTAPKMIPVTIHVDDKSRDLKKDFNVQVINHPLFSSSMIVGATTEAIFEMRGSPDDATAKVRTEVVADEIGSIVRENTFFDPVMIDMAATGDLQQILMALQNNRFYPIGVKKVDVTVEITPKHQTAQIQRIFVKESKFAPGDTIDVGIVIKPFKADPVTRTVSLKLPKDMPTGRMPLMVRGMNAGVRPDGYGVAVDGIGRRYEREFVPHHRERPAAHQEASRTREEQRTGGESRTADVSHFYRRREAFRTATDYLRGDEIGEGHNTRKRARGSQASRPDRVGRHGPAAVDDNRRAQEQGREAYRRIKLRRTGPIHGHLGRRPYRRRDRRRSLIRGNERNAGRTDACRSSFRAVHSDGGDQRVFRGSLIGDGGQLG